MGPLTEGKTRYAEKKRCGVRPKVPPPAPTPIPAKEKIIHNKGLHSQVSMCNIMSASLLFGGAGILVATTFNVLAITYIISIAISLGAVYLLSKYKSINIIHARNMKNDTFVLWFIIFFGPIMTLFVLTMLLLPPGKKVKTKGSNETK